MVHIKEVQDRAWKNKVRANLTGGILYEFNLTYGELSEAFDAWRKNPSKLGSELADVLIYLTSIAQMSDIDLDEEVLQKLAENESRTYSMNEFGHLEKDN